jgi:hypothetical protein
MCVGRSIDYLMQIPRGTFRVLKRGCSLPALIQELRASAFNGFCRIALRSGSITLVFEQGTIRLAKYDALEGDAALERIFQSGLVTVDAVLHDLSPVQLDMAMEFSPSSIVKTGMEGISTDQQDRHGISGNNYGTSPDLRKTGLKKELPDQGSRSDHAALHNIFAEKPVAESGIPSIQTSEDDTSLLSRELDALDDMDIESMTAKFRANYRLMMERLELEHLIDQNTRKDAP